MHPIVQFSIVIKVIALFLGHSSLHYSFTWNFFNMQFSLLDIHHYPRWPQPRVSLNFITPGIYPIFHKEYKHVFPLCIHIFHLNMYIYFFNLYSHMHIILICLYSNRSFMHLTTCINTSLCVPTIDTLYSSHAYLL